MLRVAVAGAGAFGQSHLRVLRELESAGAGVKLSAVVEPDAARGSEAAAKYGIPVFNSVEELLAAGQPLEAAFVAVPTVKHLAVAGALLDAGMDVLVEKPLAANLDEADDLIARAQRGGRILQPGHLERFNPAVLAVEPRLKRPMFFEAHRLSVFTPRSLDVDVVLDLMIHDLDIVLSVTPSPVREVRAVGLPIVSPRVDIANVRVEFESGCVANFTASRVSTERVRKLRFFEPRQYVSIDYARQDLLVIRMDERVPAEIAAAAAGGKLGAETLKKLMAGAAEGPAPGLSFARPEVTPGEPLRLEIESFLQSVRTRCAPKVTARQGREALKLALEIQTAMAAHAQRAGLGDFFETRY
ncbi:MAG TPA: Gfo/Idh/MocA family oxidoreductase [Terracidiphilus sp.]|nr:Gfo/Idh/MocA family oxidoreductase [Terracidiphilus sp.]